MVRIGPERYTKRQALNWSTFLFLVSHGLPAINALYLLTDPAMRPDFATRQSQYYFEGILTTFVLAVVETVIILIPYRRGERWAYWAVLAPYVGVFLPSWLVDLVPILPYFQIPDQLPRFLPWVAFHLVVLGGVGIALYLGAFALGLWTPAATPQLSRRQARRLERRDDPPGPQ